MTSPGKLAQELDTTTVSVWLDSHPEFLSDYLKKLQIQRRRSSIMNESVLADLNTISSSSTLLRSQFSNTNNSSNTLDESSKFSSLMMNSNSATVSPATSYHQQLKSTFPFLLAANNNLNPSISEPNILPAAEVLGASTNLSDHSDLPDMSEIFYHRYQRF